MPSSFAWWISSFLAGICSSARRYTMYTFSAPRRFAVRAIECIEMELGEPDASGRRRPVPKEGSNFELPVDCVIMAIGNSPNPLIRSTTEGLEANQKGCIIVDEATMATTREGVYAAGDAVSGAATVILAMGGGKEAAASIDKYIQNKAK